MINIRIQGLDGLENVCRDSEFPQRGPEEREVKRREGRGEVQELRRRPAPLKARPNHFGFRGDYRPQHRTLGYKATLMAGHNGADEGAELDAQ